MHYLYKAGGFALPAIRVAMIMYLGILLAGCGKEGPLGNTPGPKKPVWSHDFGRMN